MLTCNVFYRNLTKTLDYLDVFARFKDEENIKAVERLLNSHTELEMFERSQLGEFWFALPSSNQPRLLFDLSYLHVDIIVEGKTWYSQIYWLVTSSEQVVCVVIMPRRPSLSFRVFRIRSPMETCKNCWMSWPSCATSLSKKTYATGRSHFHCGCLIFRSMEFEGVIFFFS